MTSWRIKDGKLVDLTADEASARQAEEEAIQAGAVAAARATMVLPVDEFAAACVEAGHLTDAEALGWIKDGTLPAFVEGAIAGLPSPQAQRRARLKILSATEVSRVSPLVAAVQAAKGLSHEQVDAIFGGAS